MTVPRNMAEFHARRFRRKAPRCEGRPSGRSFNGCRKTRKAIASLVVLELYLIAGWTALALAEGYTILGRFVWRF